MSEKMRPRRSYHNLASYDDELELVRELLRYCRKYERELIEELEKAFELLCKLYEEEFPFYFKNGADQKRLNELILSLQSGNFETRLSRAIDEIERINRNLEIERMTAWFIFVHEMTSVQTAKSIGVSPQPYITMIKENPRAVTRIIEKPWCPDNKTYIDRIKDITSTMADNLRLVIVQGIRRGWSIDRMTQIFRNITGAAEYKARRLIRTETMAVYSKVTKEVFLENGIEFVEIIGDAECGGICLDYVGEAIPLKEAEVGDDLPPYHPNCACSFCAYTEFLDNSEQDEYE